jgi:uncharacterized metal-binding protein
MCTESKGCGCSGGGPKLIFACSGAADVGAIADQAARKLTRDGVGKMYCTVGLGGDVTSILDTTRQASLILALDGCPVDCVKHTLERVGLSYKHVRVTDLGFEKGKSPVNDASVAKVASKCAEVLA